MILPYKYDPTDPCPLEAQQAYIPPLAYFPAKTSSGKGKDADSTPSGELLPGEFA